jgi:hypothetical protein
MGTSSWIGDGWNAEVTSDGAIVHLTLVLAEIGVPAVARLALPSANAEQALRTLLDAAYADADLLIAAIRIHRQQRSPGPFKHTRNAGSQDCTRPGK